MPVRLLSTDTLADCAKPKLIIQGERDQYGPLPELRRWFVQLPEPKHLTVIPGAEHFFAEQQSALTKAIVDYFHSGASALGPVGP